MSDAEKTRQTSDDEGLERRTRVVSERSDSLGYIDEKIHQLKKSRAGYISVLTKVYNEISVLISGDKCNVGDIASQSEKFDTAWYEFVSVQEKYLELLESEAEKQNACDSYEEQRKRKLKLDAMVKEWHDSAKLESKHETGSKCARSRRSKCTRSEASSSKATSISKKREEMALARLKVEQLKIRQEFERQEQEIKRKKEMAEAEMEADIAAVSLEIHEKGEGSISESYELEQCISSSLRKEVIGPSEFGFTKALDDKQSHNHNIEMKENIHAPIEGGSVPKTKVFRNAIEAQKRTNVKPDNEERQSHLSTQYKELPFSLNNPACKFQEIGTVPLGFTTTTAQLFPPNPAVWTPVTTSIENRGVPASLPQKMNAPSTTEDSHQAHRVNFNIPTQQQVHTQPAVVASSSNQQQGHATPIENRPTVDDTMEKTMNERSHAEEITRALRQVVNTPKIEYLHFNGDPLKYGTFMHNFENCLERDDPDDSRKLQLLIQHCTGKAREAIESCVNLPSKEGYRLAKETLHEHFGKPHVIAMAHLKKLMDLPHLKLGDGPSLLEFSRHLSTAERTLRGMGASYVSDLNHMNTLRELAKKLPMHLRRRWTEQAGNIIEEGRKPEYADFLKFVRQRAKLVNNEFGTDMLASTVKEKGNKDGRGGKNKDETSKKDKLSSFVAGADEEDNKRVGKRVCEACSGQHRIWRCERFKVLDLSERQRVVRQKGLCNKCLERGHIAKKCPKTNFKCRVSECGAQHHTLLHRPRNVNEEQNERKQEEKMPSSKQDNGAGDHQQSKNGQHDGSVAATRTGEKTSVSRCCSSACSR